MADRESSDLGIGDYWAANVTTVATGGRVDVRSVHLSCGRFTPYAWESKQSWYQPPSRATFLLLVLTGANKADGTDYAGQQGDGAERQKASHENPQ